MCGRYVSPEETAIERLFRIGRREGDPFKRSFNVAPSMQVPVLHLQPGIDGYVLSTARWSLVPSWWKDAKPPRFTHNARIEEAAAKPMWRDALRYSRCLIPAEGWYEWQAVQRMDPATGELKPAKQPHYVYRPDRSLLCFAGLLSRWTPAANADPGTLPLLPESRGRVRPASGEKQPILTCAMLTADAAPVLGEVHERMPVVLTSQAYFSWLDTNLRDAEVALARARKGMETAFAHHAVSLRVNSKADDEDLCSPI